MPKKGIAPLVLGLRTCGEQKGACHHVPVALLLPRLTPMFLVQFPASLGFNLLFIVLLDLDLGAPGSGRRLT